MVYLELQVVVALADDVELSLAGKAQRDWRHNALPRVKLETRVLPLPPQVNQVVGLCRVVLQVQGHFGLVDAAVLGAELDFHHALCVLNSMHINSRTQAVTLGKWFAVQTSEVQVILFV